MNTQELLANLAAIALIVILTGFQINYFHGKFLSLTDSEQKNVSENRKDSNERTGRGQIKMVLEKVLVCLEMHGMKIIFFTGFCVAIKNVSFEVTSSCQFCMLKAFFNFRFIL